MQFKSNLLQWISWNEEISAMNAGMLTMKVNIADIVTELLLQNK